MAHERTDRTSRRAEIPPPEEAALRAAPQRGAAAFGGRPPLWTPLVEESQPSGLSGPYAHAPCRLKVSLSLKLRCRAPQLPPAVLSGPKIDLFVSKCVKLAQNAYFVSEMYHFVNLPPPAGCESTPFAIKGTLSYTLAC